MDAKAKTRRTVSKIDQTRIGRQFTIAIARPATIRDLI
jgi:hypothetical protein